MRRCNTPRFALYLVLAAVVLGWSAAPLEGADPPQKYKVSLRFALSVTGDLKSEDCGGNCYEGHDCTTCVGVRLFSELGTPVRTAVYDKVLCCQFCGDVDPKHSPCGTDNCPGNSCPPNTGPFLVSLLGVWDACVFEEEMFQVPAFQAVIGALINNSLSCGSNCNETDFYQPFSPDKREDAFFGGFWETCPDPSNPHVLCEPSECEAWNGELGQPTPISPTGFVRTRNPTYTWAADLKHVTHYRLIVSDQSGPVIDELVVPECNTQWCASTPTRVLDPGQHTWTVQALNSTTAGPTSVPLAFEVADEVPMTTCGEIGGSYCSQTGGCPDGFSSLGLTSDCNPCCFEGTATQCESIGGDYCSDLDGCPAGYDSLGPTFDCRNCCVSLPSCGAMGGDYCSQTGSCPAGYNSLGASYDCNPCCKTQPCTSTGCPPGSCGWQTDNCGEEIFCGDCAPSCGAMGGDYCSQTGGCPAGYSSLGASYDCNPCCKTQPCTSTGCPPGSCGWRTDNCGESIYCGGCAPSCGAMGGDYCSQTTSCPGGYTSLGPSSDCTRCCQSPPSCGAMGGDYCSQSPSCPAGYTSLGQSNDCVRCCVSN
jgi:hypothetical protein